MIEITYNKDNRLLETCIITMPDGSKTSLAPLFACQMITTKNGVNYLKKIVPTDYFIKAKILEDAGWWRWYHFDYWVNEDVKNPERTGYTTEEALKKIAGASNDT